MEEIIKELRKRIEEVERHAGLMPKDWEAKEKKLKAPKKK